MLTALTEKGRIINLIEHRHRHQDLNFKSNERFFCPQCHGQVILKQGQFRIPHFAHQKNSLCTASTEPESDTHLQGKKDLFLWLRNQELEVTVEKYIPEIKQRPDLLLKKNGVLFAIEFQCSTIPEKVIESRTKGYTSVNIIPIWILGGYPFQKKIKYHDNVFQLTDFQWTFAHFNKKNGIYLYSYYPGSKKIYLLSHLTPITPRKVFAYPSSKKLSNYLFPFNFNQSIDMATMANEKWFCEKKKWLQQKMYFAKSLKDPFLSAVYEARMFPLFLPPVIGVPVELMGMCKSHPIEWQFFIWHDVIQHIKIRTFFPFSLIENEMEKRVRKGHIQFRNVQFINPIFRKQMIYQYLKMLERIGYVKETQKKGFVMNKSIPIPNNIEDVMIFEQVLIKKLNNN